MKIEEILKEEIGNFKTQLEAQITDPVERQALADIANDLAMIPIRLSRGENVDIALKNLKAELALRGVKHAIKAQTLVQQAWMNVIFKVIGAVITAAV